MLPVLIMADYPCREDPQRVDVHGRRSQSVAIVSLTYMGDILKLHGDDNPQ